MTFFKVNSEQIANNITKKYEEIKNYFTQKPNEVIHYQYICDGCDMAPIKGVRYHCLQCPDFDFCEKCHSEKKDSHKHIFQVINQAEMPQFKKPSFAKFCEKTIHRNVSCDGCGIHPLIGIRYKCAICPNFDFCENCEKKEGLKHGHPMVRMPSLNMLRSIKCNLKDSSKKELPKDEKVFFEKINCKGCGAKSIEGTRYKCAICNNFDYCEKCLLENSEKHNHPFIKIYHQNMELESIKVDAPYDAYNGNVKPEEKKEEQKPVHYGVRCDGCNKSPIIGCRYKCAVCKNFDYCEECEEKMSEKHLHPFIKIYKPEMKLASIKCVVDENCPDYETKK